jgi:hypothetical protein
MVLDLIGREADDARKRQSDQLISHPLKYLK